MIFDHERERCEALAKRTGATIPLYMSLEVWPLEILEVLVARIEALEKQLKERS